MAWVGTASVLELAAAAAVPLCSRDGSRQGRVGPGEARCGVRVEAIPVRGAAWYAGLG